MRSLFATLRTLVLPAGAATTSPRIVLGPDVPAELQTYYSGTIGAAVLWYSGTNYWYDAAASTLAGLDRRYVGWVRSGTVHEYALFYDQASGPGVTVGFDTAQKIQYGSSIRANNPVTEYFRFNASMSIFAEVGSAVQIDGDCTIASLEHSQNSQTTASTTSSTTYANLTNIAGLSFVAPASGKITILYTSRMSNDSAAGGAVMAPWVGTGSTVGSGTEVLATADANALIFFQHSAASESVRFGSAHNVAGLTPGDTYNVSMRGRAASGGGTATFDDTTTTIMPSP